MPTMCFTHGPHSNNNPQINIIISPHHHSSSPSKPTYNLTHSPSLSLSFLYLCISFHPDTLTPLNYSHWV
ncbi:hypothetical protein RIF29_03785 [Crotalaria pallida]|uniref:Uncharacterized protein n=1 Tax=Crotalaria pallida TaxID=3830 RepID=A0AAN9P9H5_CROPI